jgi:hypothetical protein
MWKIGQGKERWRGTNGEERRREKKHFLSLEHVGTAPSMKIDDVARVFVLDRAIPLAICLCTCVYTCIYVWIYVRYKLREAIFSGPEQGRRNAGSDPANGSFTMPLCCTLVSYKNLHAGNHM